MVERRVPISNRSRVERDSPDEPATAARLRPAPRRARARSARTRASSSLATRSARPIGPSRLVTPTSCLGIVYSHVSARSSGHVEAGGRRAISADLGCGQLPTIGLRNARPAGSMTRAPVTARRSARPAGWCTSRGATVRCSARSASNGPPPRRPPAPYPAALSRRAPASGCAASPARPRSLPVPGPAGPTAARRRGRPARSG
jgi:hypothetical protein